MELLTYAEGSKKLKRTYNISLAKLAGFRKIHPILLLKKLWNEVFNRTTRKQKALPAGKVKKTYQDKLSFIICTMGESDTLPQTIRSLRQQEIGESFEIILVDNSPQGIFLPLKAEDSIRYVRVPELGLSRARNAGAKAAKGEYLFYIDDDAVADPRAAAGMLEAFRRHKKAGVVGGQILLELPVPAPLVFVPGRESVWSGYAVKYQKYREVREQYAFPYGACFGIRHSVFEAFGGFPESYGRTGHDYAGGEETAVCFDVLRLGYRIGIMPSVVVYHHVAPERFTKEHIRKTIRAGILTTHRLYLDGHAPEGWTKDYVSMRIDIARKEIQDLCRRGNEREAFYTKCEQEAFLELYSYMEDRGVS